MITETYWQHKIGQENRNYKTWEDLFMCKDLEDYWEGRQWKAIGVARTSYKPYVLNMIYATIKIKLANIIYQRPQFLITPKPGHGDWDLETAMRSAEIKEGALNTTCQNPKIHFVKNIRLAALDSYLRGFGIVEVGYAADWQNPNKLPLTTNVDQDSDLNGNVQLKDLKVRVDNEVPENERFYIKHIKARRFRVSVEDDPILDNCSWCGYYSFMRKSVLAKTPGITLPSQLKTAYYSVGMGDKMVKRSNDTLAAQDYLTDNSYFKVWRIWNNLEKKKIMVIEDQGWPQIFEDKFERLPFPNVYWDDRAPSKENIGWYPMPPVWQWISSQDEINQAREQVRNFRKRFVRKFWFNKNVDVDEIQKLSNNVDGAAIKLKGNAIGDQSVGTIANPEVGVTLNESIQLSTADHNVITGTSANARQQTDRTTATESKIIDTRAQIRESVEQLDFSQFVCDIGREGLLTMHERFTEGMWVKLTIDPSANYMEEYQDSQVIYQYVSNQEITDGAYDWDIDIDVQNGTPEQMQQEQTKFFTFMQIVMQNPQIALSPILLRETAAKLNYKNERVVREFQKAAMMKIVQQQTQMMMGGSGGQGGAGGVAPPSSNGQSMLNNANPNPMNEIMGQLQQQLGI